MPRKIEFEVGGQLFSIFEDNIQNGPLSRLRNIRYDGSFPDNRITFDRPPDIFAAILAFYQTGELHIPMTSCPAAFLNELQFWEIPAEHISLCCLNRLEGFLSEQENLKKFKKSMEQTTEEPDIDLLDKHYRFMHSIRRKIWNIVDQKESSIFAKIYFVTAILMVFVSIFTIAYSTDPAFQRPMTNCERLEYLAKYDTVTYDLIADVLLKHCEDEKIPIESGLDQSNSSSSNSEYLLFELNTNPNANNRPKRALVSTSQQSRQPETNIGAQTVQESYFGIFKSSSSNLAQTKSNISMENKQLSDFQRNEAVNPIKESPFQRENLDDPLGKDLDQNLNGVLGSSNYDDEFVPEIDIESFLNYIKKINDLEYELNKTQGQQEHPFNTNSLQSTPKAVTTKTPKVQTTTIPKALTLTATTTPKSLTTATPKTLTTIKSYDNQTLLNGTEGTTQIPKLSNILNTIRSAVGLSLDKKMLMIPNMKLKIYVLVVFEGVVTAFFTIDIVLRLSSTPQISRYFASLVNLSDAIAIVCTYAQFVLNYVFSEERFKTNWVDYLNYLQLLRSLRLFRIISNVRAGKVLAYSARNNFKDLSLLILFLVSGMCVFASIFFIVESKENVESIPVGWYWAVVTMTTVGYGDISPKTGVGRLLACCCSVCGIILLALTVPMFTNQFLTLYQHVDAENQVAKHFEKKKRSFDEKTALTK